MPDTLIFDLDDTLLVNPVDRFLPPYFQALTAHLAQFVPPNQIVPALLRATKVMIANRDHTLTNERVFAESFYPALGLDELAMRPSLARFYEEEFPKLRGHTGVVPEARSLLITAHERGYGLVIATNPVFPLRAIEHRLDWAGVGDLPFLFITAYETMHYTKPHVEYYQEILDHIGRSADRCLMVGNEIENDIIPAKALGMQTFLVMADAQTLTPALSQWERGPEWDYAGTLADLLRLIETHALRQPFDG
jgi:HAD superfamily hydrolase (TIGR01549 family)